MKVGGMVRGGKGNERLSRRDLDPLASPELTPECRSSKARIILGIHREGQA